MNPAPRSRFANETRRQLDRRDETLRDGARLLAQRLGQGQRRGWSRDRHASDRGAARGATSTSAGGAPNRDAACASAARIVSSAVTCRSGVFLWRRLRVAGLCSLLGFFRRIVGLFVVPAGRLVVGRVEPGALEMNAGAARDQPLRALAAHWALRVALTRDARKRFFKQVPVRTLVFIGWHRSGI